MQEDLVEDRTEDIAVAFMGDGVFDGFGNRAAKAAAGAGELFEDFAADVRRVGRRSDDARTVSAHKKIDAFVQTILYHKRGAHTDNRSLISK